jgi:acyl-coenzyme A synthetase/AMP-(fatty) acid ligase
MNLLRTLLAEAEARSGRTALIAKDGANATYGDLIRMSAGLAAVWRRKGICAGDRVLVAMPLAIPLYAGLIALWRLGAVVVFPEPAMGLRGLADAIRATCPKAFLAAGAYRMLRFLVPDVWRIPVAIAIEEDAVPGDTVESVPDDHPALISFTSGSTGRPKAILRSHAFLARQNDAVASVLAPQRDDEIDLVGFPAFVLANLGLGVTSVLPNWSLRRPHTLDPAAIVEHLSKHKATRILVPPFICERLVGQRSVADLGAIFTGGGPVFPDLLERLSLWAPTADVVTVYGSTEAEPITHLHARDITAADWSAMQSGAGLLSGTPVAGISVTIRDHEILVAGDHVNKGYLDASDDASTKITFAGKRWHRTGDAGRVDEAGRLWLLGRLDGRAGGIFPFGIESAARFWPGVAKAALVSVNGRSVLAVVGDVRSRGRWQDNATAFGDVQTVPVKSIPMDRRHRSKVDYPALRQKLASQI